MNRAAEDDAKHTGDTAGRDLAASHRLSEFPPAPIALLDSLPEISEWLDRALEFCRDPPSQHRRAADWLLDNDHQILRAIRRLREDLPRDFYRRLPALDGERDGGLPRAYVLASAALDGLQPQVSFFGLVEFVAAYQSVSRLNHGELWALPSMLRLGCLERLCDAFGQLNPQLAPPVEISSWSAMHEAEDATDRIARAIGGLTAVHSIRWADFVDRTSAIDAVLNADPAGAYASMTFDTRERYRKAVEQLSLRSGVPEIAVARLALTRAGNNKGNTRQEHVGYWLVDDGLRELRVETGYKATASERLRRHLARHAGPLYAAGLSLGVIVALFLPGAYLYASSANGWQWAAGLGLSFLPATVLSVTVAHWLITTTILPGTLPEMDFSRAIPGEFATAIVIPTIIAHPDEVEPVLDRLELHRLSNPDPSLSYVLLSDPCDARSEHLPDDRRVEEELVRGLRRLNARYGRRGVGPFVLLHRGRRFNACENCWIAWERKRGKLEQFNRLVTTGEVGDFALTEGAVDTLRNIRFAITLDADTDLPPGVAARLAGTLAHPLNRAVFDPGGRRPTAGYSILQPRVELQPSAGIDTVFSHIYSGDTAVDIYSRAVSDVYQDLFGTGIFVGKGIYDIAAVQRSLAGRVPENRILSHDLFEGVHGRAALVSNITLYEDFPGTYLDFAMRSHRWQRGDWQLLPWLRRTVPSQDGKDVPTPLTMLDRWKIADNLRRSLIAPALLMLFIGGWTFLPGNAALWTLLALLAPGSYLIGEVVSAATGGISRGFVTDSVHRFSQSGGRWLLSIIFLVSDTLIALDAMCRTLWRLTFSKRNLLEWRSAAHASADISRHGLRAAAWNLMWPSSALAFLLGTHLGLYDLTALIAAAPILVLWLAAPEIAIRTARRRTFRRETLDGAQRDFLLMIARRTWHFFETFTGPADNWLPPDNFQESPESRIAHRTSPTNIGMYLTSTMTARDLGFIPNSDFLVRCRNSLQSMDRMRSHRGHLLNWYDTRSLEPLEPNYVSTVDSGNLAISLIALKQGCIENADGPAVHAACLDGLAVTLGLALEAARGLASLDNAALDRSEHRIRKSIADARASPVVWYRAIDALGGEYWAELEGIVREAIARSGDIAQEVLDEIHVWLDRYHHHVTALLRDGQHYLPWLPLIDRAPLTETQLARDVARSMSPATGIATMIQLQSSFDEEIKLRLKQHRADSETTVWLAALRQALHDGTARQQILRNEFAELARRAAAFAYGMEFGFLYNPEVRLFAIGYNLSGGQMDANHYDLLATEARLASFFAIAKQDAPVEHWFSFSRPITRLRGKPAILSWNGSMFEYLMPPLFLPSRRDTLLGESELLAVDFQQLYAADRGVPWGISESAFAATDSEGNYQYRAFGVPGLGIRRGLTRDLVVAPYSTALALCVRPRSSVENLRDLQKLGAVTCYGFIEALDFTPSRVSRERSHVPVQTYMAHHQGMVIAAIANALGGDILVRRVGREKSLRAVELLLHEQVPRDVPVDKSRADEAWERHVDTHAPAAPPPWMPSPDASSPQMHLLGNGRLASLVSASGAGGLSWRGHALTRWRPDPTRDNHGLAVYIRDADNNRVWSAGRFPTGIRGGDERVVFHQHMVDMFRRDHGIATRMELTVAPFADAEIRRLTLTNESERTRTIELTSYAEIVLAPSLDDERHPAFSKLFVSSEYLAGERALLFQRRPRRRDMAAPVLLQKFVTGDADAEFTGFDTDREGFVGRNGSLKAPHALREGLKGKLGWTRDPIASQQVRIRLKPRQEKQVSILTLAGSSRDQARRMAAQFSAEALDRVFREAALEAAREVQRSGTDPSQLPALQVLSSLLLQPNPAFRNPGKSGTQGWGGQPDLWRFGISGDHPLLLLRTGEEAKTTILDTLVRARALWHRRRLVIDLVVLREGISGYEGPLRERILSILRDSHSEGLLGRNGGIHLLSSDQMSAEARRGLEMSAQVVLTDDQLTLVETLDQVLELRRPPPRFVPVLPVMHERAQELAPPTALSFANGYGGFDPRTGDYIIHLEPGSHTPAPWCNVLANDNFGTIVSEAGLGFTWAVNSGEHRLTPWSNDPVADEAGEILYLRDEASSEVWTTTPMPLGNDVTCQIRHGAGYTSWTQNSLQIEQELNVLVAPDAPVKLVRLRLRNVSNYPRRITATYYAEWLLGAMASVSKPHVVCHYDPARKAIIARNRWNPEFGARVAFLAASADPHSVSGDRRDFLGREGDPAMPDALRRWDLGSRFTPGGDACAAYQVHLDIAPRDTAEVVFALGEAQDDAEAGNLIEKWRRPGSFDAALDGLAKDWKARLGSVQVKTPDPAFDLMVNRWLTYQNLSCRIRARAGFYQAGGAFGFRDQLQDALGLLFADPGRARTQILEAARHQFEAGDVLHWWHPPEGRGVRTRCSDDFLWLAYVTARYVEATGDRSILDETVPFLTAPELKDDEEDRYARFESGPPAPLKDHCARALDRAMSTGAHGLPLIGTGDWNDGMDRIGAGGRGESHWLAWFHLATIRLFAPLAEGTDLADRADRWRAHANNLRDAMAEHGWDGGWYLRAYDDEGLPWGSQSNDECQIDLIAQAWSVLAGEPVSDRSRAALEAAYARLVSPDDRLVRLLDPPFHDTARDPGYIRAYPPGIRENGGQYTHAAAWLGHAFAAIGDGDRAWQIFDIINPIRRSATREDAEHYKREPYVLAGDVSATGAHHRQGGWSWYTGAAGWTWQLAVSGILGVRQAGNKVHLSPCLPKNWGGAEIRIESSRGTLEIVIDDPSHLGTGFPRLSLDGKTVEGTSAPFPGPGKTRKVLVELGQGPG